MEKIHLLITRRGPVWRVRVLIHGQPRPRWRAYRVAEYPTPEAVVRRCMAGLSRRGEDERHDDHDTDSDQKISQHGGPLRVRWECWGRLA
ncbi:hypothetical protein Bwad002_17610 [Bilophila wadsworthia]